jgi:hypothetical protein
LPNADGTIESPSPEGNTLTQITEHHIPLHLSLTGNLMSSHNYFSRSELWIRIQGFDDQKLRKKKQQKFVNRGIFLDFIFFCVLYSTLLHLPPLRFHCVGRCWDRTQDSCDFGIGSQTL